MAETVRARPPLPGTPDVADCFLYGVYTHNERNGRRFADELVIPHVLLELELALTRPEIQCVYVGNHPRHHAETVEAALLAGKHVFCEPPLALTTAAIEALQGIATTRGLVLAANYRWRLDPLLVRMRALLEEDAIGELLGGRISNTLFLPPSRQSWRLQTPGGGVILDRTLHDLDTLMALLGMRAGEVQCLASQRLLGTDVEEEIIGAVKLVGGLTVQLFDSFLLPHVPVTIDFYGSNGQLQATSCDPGNPTGGLHLQRNGQVTQVAVLRHDPRGAVLDGVVAAIRHGHPVPAGSGDDMRALSAALAMVESIRTGGIVQRARF